MEKLATIEFNFYTKDISDKKVGKRESEQLKIGATCVDDFEKLAGLLLPLA